MFPVDLLLLSPLLHFAALVGLLLVGIALKRPKRTKFQNPFKNDARKPREPLECDPKNRSLRLCQPFSEKLLPSEIDAIVIGSGIGGLATAAILAKSGRKVVVLEQHCNAGGCCQSFIQHGYEWDVGIQYVGHMGPNDFERFVVDQLTEGQLDWARLEEDYDNVVLAKFPDDYLTIPIWGDRNRLLSDLIERYPNQETGIEKFFASMTSTSIAMAMSFFPVLKVMPLWLSNFILKLFPNMFQDLNSTTVRIQLDRLFGPGETELKLVLGYLFGDYGVEPSRAGVGLLLSTYNYYKGGAYYPVGGAGEIPFTLIPVVEQAGGRVFVNANVTEILLSPNGSEATGVRVCSPGCRVVDIRAPLVISDAGVSNTFRRLLPKEVVVRTRIGDLLQSNRLHPSQAMFQVYVGLKGSQEELQLPAKNFWVYYDYDVDKILFEWRRLDLETAVFETKLPMMFVAFPSAKDPAYNKRFPDRSSCLIVTFTPMKWFRKWEKEPLKSRGHEYQHAKMELANRCWQLVVEMFPELGDQLDFIDAGSPLTMASCINAFAGEPYGLDQDVERFSNDAITNLRPEIPEIKNLYLTGQDVLACGFLTCVGSALLTCQAIMQPLGESANLFNDLKQLFNDRHLAGEEKGAKNFFQRFLKTASVK